MTIRIETSFTTGSTLFATLVRESDGYYWDNNSTQSWLAAPSVANKKITLTEGSSENASSYVGTNSGNLGDAGWVTVRIHDDVNSDIVIGVGRSYIIGGVEVQNIDCIVNNTTAALNLKQSLLAFTYFTVQTAEAAANTSTTFDTDLPLENNDYYGSSYGGLVIGWISTANNKFQTRNIIASATGTLNTRITLDEALDTTPNNGDIAIVIGRR